MLTIVERTSNFYQNKSFYLVALAAVISLLVLDNANLAKVLLVVTIFYVPFPVAGVVRAFYRKRELESKPEDFLQQTEEEEDHFPSLSILVPAWNERRTINEFLDRLLTCDYPGKKEIIFIAGGEDGTYDYLQNLVKNLEEKIIVLEQRPDDGKTDSLERGFRESQGEIIISMDADTFVNPDFLTKITEPIRKGYADLSSPIALPRREQKGILKKWHQMKSYSTFILDKTYYTSGQVARAIPRKALESISGFAQVTNLADEADLEEKLKKSGYNRFYNRSDLFVETDRSVTLANYLKTEYRYRVHAVVLILKQLKAALRNRDFKTALVKAINFLLPALVFIGPIAGLFLISFQLIFLTVVFAIWVCYMIKTIFTQFGLALGVSVLTGNLSYLKEIPIYILAFLLNHLISGYAFLNHSSPEVKYGGARKVD